MRSTSGSVTLLTMGVFAFESNVSHPRSFRLPGEMCIKHKTLVLTVTKALYFPHQTCGVRTRQREKPDGQEDESPVVESRAMDIRPEQPNDRIN